MTIGKGLDEFLQHHLAVCALDVEVLLSKIPESRLEYLRKMIYIDDETAIISQIVMTFQEHSQFLE